MHAAQRKARTCAQDFRNANTLRSLSMRTQSDDQSCRIAPNAHAWSQHQLASIAAKSSDRLQRTVGPSSTLSRLKLGLLLLTMIDRGEAVHPTPAGLTELSSAEGIQMLQSSSPVDQFWLLAQEFTTQDSQDWCGLASASMVLNALPVPKPALRAFDG